MGRNSSGSCKQCLWNKLYVSYEIIPCQNPNSAILLSTSVSKLVNPFPINIPFKFTLTSDLSLTIYLANVGIYTPAYDSPETKNSLPFKLCVFRKSLIPANKFSPILSSSHLNSGS